ncbi:MAG: hypothetical protein M3O67_03030 [Bacteroidota bacterium]|nr:hypothetical protein [Bacteroidota bacterium]
MNLLFHFMRFSSFIRFTLLAFVSFVLFSCDKKTEEFQTEALGDYIPLQIGKYIIYRLDSTVFPNFGRSIEIHKYQVKHLVESRITDNLGRPSYRIFRYLSDVTGTQPWIPNGSYFITPLTDQIEVVENNLRFIKMHLPIREGFTWKGNSYLPTDPYDYLNHLNNYDDISGWDYTFKGINDTIINQQPIKDVLTVEEANEISIPDTIIVLNNQVTIPDEANNVWVKGPATSIINIITQTNNLGRKLSLTNVSNFALTLNGINTPPNKRREYEYKTNGWTFGNNTDTLVTSSPEYGSVDYAIEKYAKGIGLVYREYILWENQPNESLNPIPPPVYTYDPFKIGFGIKMWMISHN